MRAHLVALGRRWVLLLVRRQTHVRQRRVPLAQLSTADGGGRETGRVTWEAGSGEAAVVAGASGQGPRDWPWHMGGGLRGGGGGGWGFRTGDARLAGEDLDFLYEVITHYGEK